jgi:hypothetical protein
MLWLLLVGLQSEPLKPFSDYFFEARFHRIERVDLDGYLKLKEFHALLRDTIEPSKLDFETRLDYDLLNLWLEGRLEAYRLRQKGAETPFADLLLPSNFGHQWFSLAKGDLARRAKRAAEKIRAAKLPALSAAQVEVGSKQLQKIEEHLKATLDILRKDFPDRAKELVEAFGELSDSLKALRLEASPDAQAPPDRKPTPAEHYQHLLKHQIYTDFTPDKLREFGQAHFDQTVRDLEALAKKIDPTKTWLQLVEDTKKKQFTVDTLHDESAKLALRARDFAIEKDLVTIPPEARDFEIRRADPRAITPFGHYQQARDGKKGAYISAPLPKTMSDDERAQRLRDNNLYWTTVVSLHEAVPGHHLQFEVLKTVKRPPIRTLFFPTTYVEGWGLYCEHMMFLNKYFGDDPLYELTLLRMKLWRCARILIDVGLQTGEMTKDKAVALLVDKVRLEPLSAKFEVDHYQGRPTYFTGYLIGYTFFVELRKKCQAVLGAKFDQKAFHDKLLTVGPLPVAPLERVMLHWAKPD